MCISYILLPPTRIHAPHVTSLALTHVSCLMFHVSCFVFLLFLHVMPTHNVFRQHLGIHSFPIFHYTYYSLNLVKPPPPRPPRIHLFHSPFSLIPTIIDTHIRIQILYYSLQPSLKISEQKKNNVLLAVLFGDQSNSTNRSMTGHLSLFLFLNFLKFIQFLKI